ncbi:hypothetical protein BGW38_009246 [Lunasporangiospora selenospora]|uniref:Uncharacterized protein n=1 Tax=Lunasporangiospora selenospora TaxID=979761 RepID=A0A9P6FXA5_9FUNG|nr:hypothetical protein BGW38_009246 [Lunasporangiospora selenospora]
MSLGPSRPQVKWEFDVQDLFPLFEQLEELEIQGTIFRLDFELLRRRYPSLDIPPRTLSRKILADSSMSDMTTYPPSSSHLPQWKVKRLLTPDDWMLMLAFCPDLSDLDLRENFVVKLEALFIPQTSVSGDDNDSDLGDWACKDLETLSMQLSSSRDESVNARLMPRWPRREKDIPVPNEACIRRWGDVYRQLGQLTKLKTLVIFCNELHIALNIGDQANKGSLGGSGIEQLGGETGKMQQLETLALSDMMGVRWEFEVLEALLNMVPKLKSLYLRPLYSSNSQEIMQWLADMDRGDVVFESNAPILETP